MGKGALGRAIPNAVVVGAGEAGVEVASLNKVIQP